MFLNTNYVFIKVVTELLILFYIRQAHFFYSNWILNLPEV